MHCSYFFSLLWKRDGQGKVRWIKDKEMFKLCCKWDTSITETQQGSWMFVSSTFLAIDTQVWGIQHLISPYRFQTPIYLMLDLAMCRFCLFKAYRWMCFEVPAAGSLIHVLIEWDCERGDIGVLQITLLTSSRFRRFVWRMVVEEESDVTMYKAQKQLAPPLHGLIDWKFSSMFKEIHTIMRSSSFQMFTVEGTHW